MIASQQSGPLLSGHESRVTNHPSRITNHESRVVPHGWRALLQRFAKFSAVGAGGVAVQAVTLALLLRVSGLHYLAATALAVEASVLHNFVWHRKWTWRDRPQPRWAIMLLRFTLTNGAMSIVANLVLMFVFAGLLKLNPNAANLLAITICSLINFTLSDRVVFV
ncbi:MAG: GtrA family protein [Acidobacteriota bacterium]